MNLFVMAFPNGGGSKYHHQRVLWVDISKRVVFAETSRICSSWGFIGDSSRTVLNPNTLFDERHQGLPPKNSESSSFDMAESLRRDGMNDRDASNRWASGLAGIKSHRKQVVTNGRLRIDVRFRGGVCSETDEVYAFPTGTPMRFCPIGVDFLRGLSERHSSLNEGKWEESYRLLSPRLWHETILTHSSCMYQWAGTDEEFSRWHVGALELFHSLSYSQITFKVEKGYYSEACKRPHEKLTKAEWLRMRLGVTGDGVGRKFFPHLTKKTSNAVGKKALRRCVERFVRRHPTLATRNLLRMLAVKDGMLKIVNPEPALTV